MTVTRADSPPAPTRPALSELRRHRCVPRGSVSESSHPLQEAPALLNSSPKPPASPRPRDRPSLHRHRGGRRSRAKPKAILPGTPPRQPGLVEREWALEPDCLGLNPSPTTCWWWGPGCPPLWGQSTPTSHGRYPTQGECELRQDPGRACGTQWVLHKCPLPQGTWCLPMSRVLSFQQQPQLNDSFQAPQALKTLLPSPRATP